MAMANRRMLVVGLVLAGFVAACTSVAPPTSTPGTTTSAPATQRPRPTTTAGVRSTSPVPNVTAAELGCAEREPPRVPFRPDPIVIPPVPKPPIADPDRAAGRAISDAIARLDALQSYRFTSGVSGRAYLDLSEPTTLDFGFQALTTPRDRQAIKGVIGTRMREANGNGASVSGGQEVLFGGGWGWGTSNISGVLEPMPLDDLGPLLEIAPAGVLRRHLEPFAAGFRRVGRERHEGVASIHYQATAATRRAIAKLAKFDGNLKADVWIAEDGGWLAGAEISGTAKAVDDLAPDFVFIQVEVSHPDDPSDVITLPAMPVPEPVRATREPVHLRLTYAVDLGPNGEITSDKERAEMGVTMRRRLDVAHRQVTVDDVPGGRLVVTSCFTTEPDRDRELTSQPGALTVVPLPSDRYGSDASPGPEGLPAVGGTIDPSLPPIAPADRVDASVHVDPATGERGVAFRLANAADAVYRPWAEAHANDWIAVVLDGTVLGVQAVRDHVAEGKFAFTGDYTTAETERLRDVLQAGPLAGRLRLVEDVEIPA
jgi:hypothetical protein